jgi:hypothetical protein
MMFWIYDFSSWLVAMIFCVVFVAMTWLGIFLVRSTIHSWIHRHSRTNDMVDAALQSFFVLFGLLLGLVAVATYQDYSTVSDLVDKEASSIAALYRDFTAYPESIRTKLHDLLREYVRFTLENDWPQQRAGIVPTDGTARVDALFRVLVAFEPTRKSEEIIHAEALRQINQFVELRRSRLASVATGLPPVLWWVVAVGALLNITLIWIQDMDLHIHLILGAILASILGLVIFLIAALDNPFRGIVGIDPAPISLVYETLMQQDGPEDTTKAAPGKRP